MFCKNCGAKLDDDAQFCEKCGTVVKRPAVQQPKPVEPEEKIARQTLPTESPAEPPVSAEPVQSAETQAEPTAQGAEEKTPAKKPAKGLLIGIAAVAAVIVVAVVLFAILGKGSPSGNYTMQANINNGARFTYSGNRLYFIGSYRDSDEGTSLYSTNYKGGDRELLSDDENISAILWAEGKLYFETSDDDTHSLNVMNGDGTNLTIILESDDAFYDFDVVGNKLYYRQEKALHVCDLKGNNDTVLLESVCDAALDGGYLYYVDEEDVIYAYQIKSGKTKELAQASGARSLVVYGDTLYFKCDTGLSSVPIKGDTGVRKVVRDEDMGNYTIYDDHIYYIQRWSDSFRESVVKYMVGSNSDISATTYTFMLIGVGDIYRTDMDGSNQQDTDANSSAIQLFAYPNGMYSRFSAFTNGLSEVEFSSEDSGSSDSNTNEEPAATQPALG